MKPASQGSSRGGGRYRADLQRAGWGAHTRNGQTGFSVASGSTVQGRGQRKLVKLLEQDFRDPRKHPARLSLLKTHTAFPETKPAFYCYTKGLECEVPQASKGDDVSSLTNKGKD